MRFLAKRYILITFSGAAILACFCAMALVWALEAKRSGQNGVKAMGEQSQNMTMCDICPPAEIAGEIFE